MILNPTAIIGPHDYRPSHFGQVLLALCHGRLPALVAGGFDWVDARDVVSGAMRAEKRAPSGARYLLSGHWLSARDVALMVQEISGVRAPRLVCPIWLAHIVAPFAVAWARFNGGRPLYTPVSLRALRSNRQISHERATRDLGYRSRPFRETLVDTLGWFQEASCLERPRKQSSAEVS